MPHPARQQLQPRPQRARLPGRQRMPPRHAPQLRARPSPAAGRRMQLMSRARKSDHRRDTVSHARPLPPCLPCPAHLEHELLSRAQLRWAPACQHRLLIATAVDGRPAELGCRGSARWEADRAVRLSMSPPASTGCHPPGQAAQQLCDVLLAQHRGVGVLLRLCSPQQRLLGLHSRRQVGQTVKRRDAEQGCTATAQHV